MEEFQEDFSQEFVMAFLEVYLEKSGEVIKEFFGGILGKIFEKFERKHRTISWILEEFLKKKNLLGMLLIRFEGVSL